MKNCIEYESVSFSYKKKGKLALNDITFSVKHGCKFAVLGPNGAGKTTLFKLAVGLLAPKKGIVRVLEKEVTENTIGEIRQDVGYLFQNPDDQLFAPTVWEDVAFGPRNLGMDEDEVAKRVTTALREVNMLGYADHPPFQLSEGQKKRVAIAGLLVMNPKILLLDEPTSDLDVPTAISFMEKVRELVERGVTATISTHDILFARKWADECVVLNSGSILFFGSPVEAFEMEEVRKAIGDPDYFLPDDRIIPINIKYVGDHFDQSD